MAKLTGVNEREAAAMQVMQEHTVTTPLAPTDSAEKRIAVSWPSPKVYVDSDSDLYYAWSLTNADTVNSSNNLRVYGDVHTPLDVPWGMLGRVVGSTIYLCLLKVDPGTAEARVALS